MDETRCINDEKILQDKNKNKTIRIELLRLMALDDEWHREKTSELYKKIMACREELRRLTSDKRKIRRMSQEKYMRLRVLRHTRKRFLIILAFLYRSLNKWNQSKGINCEKKMTTSTINYSFLSYNNYRITCNLLFGSTTAYI